MLISSWLKSFRNHLQTRPRRIVRHNRIKATGKRAEDLEIRSLLAAPTLVAVRPNVGEFLVENEIRDTSPNELTLQFNPGQVIDVASIDGNVMVDRAGHDGTFGDGNEVPVTVGFVGIGDNPEEVVIRFAENLPDDHYRITVTGGLQNVNIGGDPVNNGDAFNNGVTDTFDFSLDLGARIVAVDPQPVSRDETTGELSQARDQIVLYFNEDDLDTTSAEDVRLYQLIHTNQTATNLDDSFTFPDSATYDSDANTVTLEFSDDIDLLFGDGAYRLRVGNRLTNDVWPPAPPTPFVPAAEAGPIHANAADLGALTGANASLTVDGTINITGATGQTAFPFDYPGAEDEPGHRQVEAQTHINDPADADPEILTQFYNFDPVYGDHPNNSLGLNPTNSITEGQKARTREIFEFYGTYLGIDFVESDTQGFTIATGDIRVLSPTAPLGAGGVLGIAGGGLAIMDDAESWEDKPGGNWFQTAMHEIGHLLGVGHAAELPQVTINSANSANGFGAFSRPGVNAEPDYPGDHDIVHGLHLHRSDSIDIDRYNFSVPTTGVFTVEVMAERLADSSLLDSKLTLYKREGGLDVLIAQNDDYFSEDSFIELMLEPGDYSLAVASTDNGSGGTSQGDYNLRINFQESANPATSLIDADLDELGVQNETLFDGDNDGEAGGVYNFWFSAASAADTLFVDKIAASGGNGAITTPFQNIDDALSVATEGQIVRIVGNDTGNDGDTSNDIPYLIGQDLNNNTLPDGSTLDVPRGVTVMIDAGAIFKLRSARIGVGSSSTLIDRSGGALQVLGRPGEQVIFTSLLDETTGTDTTPTPTTPDSGNWGGLSFRNDVDEAQGRFSYRSEGIFLNHVGQASLRFGGGNAVVDSILQPINPVNMIDAQPTITYNTITNSADSAIAANPDSFEEFTFHTPEFQDGAPIFNSDYKRIGPDISWNVLTENSTNGLFVKVDTAAGSDIEKLTVPGRFDDTDIVHVIAQNVAIQGTPGGPIRDETAPDVALVTATIGASAGTSTFAAAGTYDYRVVFVDENGFESPASAVTPSATIADTANESIVLTGLPPASAEYVGRRIYRSTAGPGAPYTLAAELDKSALSFIDTGVDLGRQLNAVTSRLRGRTDASLTIDPGVIVKLEGSRIEAEFGTQLIAEGHLGQEIIFTSRRDDRYGAGGTFDTNDDDNNVNEINPVAGDWGGIYIGHRGSVSIDHTLVTFAGGVTPLESDFAAFNALEIHQATARVRNSVFVNNADGQGGSSPDDRFGLYENESGAIFVRGAQPVILDTRFDSNAGPVITINTNAVNSLNLTDPGRSTGHADQQIKYIDNQGPLVRDNAFENNEFNGMQVRGEVVTTQGVWDDTDIVHVLRDEIFIPDLHVSGGIRLESSATESLVVKLDGPSAGITTGGNAQDIVDRIGGMLHVVGQPGSPVIFTSISDDSAGAGFDLSGFPQFDTNSDGLSTGSPGDWNGLEIEQFAHDRNVGVFVENELSDAAVPESNALIAEAEVVGLLAEDEYSGDENLRLGFEIHGTIDSFDDADTYSFKGFAGQQVWLDIDKTSLNLDTVIELLDANGQVLATSNDNDASIPAGGSTQAFTLDYSPHVSRDLYTLNALDAGMRVVLPGSAGAAQNYFVRVSSRNSTAGVYQLQIRLKETDEFAGTTIQHAEIRYATNGLIVPAAPIHSPLTGEVSNFNFPNSAAQMGPLLNSDRAVISAAGNLTAGDDDRFTFSVFHNPTQASGGAGTSDPTPVSVVFDLDFADGQSRANTTIAVYDSDNQLVLIGRDSNVLDDQQNELDGDTADVLSRGSYGHLDAYIGPVELNPGNYTMQVFANDSVPSAIGGYLTDTGANLVRLEPVDTVQRVAEERFGNNDTITTGSAPIVDLFTVNGGTLDQSNVVPFSLADVSLFVSNQGGVLGGSEQTTVSQVDPFTGVVENTVGEFGQPVRDISFRPDGQLYAYTTGPQNGNFTPANAGNYLQIDTGTAAATSQGDDGITLNRDNLAGTPLAPTPGDNTVTADPGAVIQYNALLHTGTTQWSGLAVGDRVRNGTAIPNNTVDQSAFQTNILYAFDISTGAADTRNLLTNDARAYTGPGSTQRAIGQITTQLDGGGTPHTIVGLSLVNGQLFGLDDAGFVYSINAGNANTVLVGSVSTYDAGADAYVQVADTFGGLTEAPANVENGAYSDLMFAITTGGEMFAINTIGEAQPIFVNGADSVDTGINNAHGLSFGTLERNLWHLTTTGDDTNQENVAGHGIIADVDDSRLNENGGTSLYFGSTVDSAAAGNQNNLSGTQVNDYNFPGGAHGTVVSNEFDLSDYSFEDKPTLYFNYRLDTDGTNGTQNANSMQDSFRVFVGDETRDWSLVVTNNSFENANQADEFDHGPDGTQSSNPTLQSFPDVNEAFDGAGWRQARIDLSNFAGRDSLRLRFDFATAGAMDLVGAGIRSETELVAVSGDQIQDGDTFTIDGVNFEFEMGPSLTFPSGDSLVGQTFDVALGGPATTFTFVAGGGGGTNIGVQPGDSANSVAQSVLNAINAVFGAGTAFVANNRVNIPAGTVTGVAAPIQLTGAAGFASPQDVSINVAMTADEVAVQIQRALAEQFSGWVPDDDLVARAGLTANQLAFQNDLLATYDVHNSSIRIIQQDVDDAGPLTSREDLQGDEFGSLGEDVFSPGRPGATRGQDNAHFGVFIDDIIIGFAERGEQVLNAPAASATLGLVANPHVTNTDRPAGLPYVDILTGAYDLEVRRAGEVAAPGMLPPPNNLFPSMDTNDRSDQGTSITVPDFADIPDNSTFNISDGINDVTFEFVDNTDGTTQGSPGNIWILYSPVTNSATYAGAVFTNMGAAVRAAINSGAVQGVLDVVASLSDGVATISAGNTRVVSLSGNAIVTVGPTSTLSSETFSTYGDSNHFRDQGQIIIDSSVVSNSLEFGIRARIDDDFRQNGEIPIPGGPRSLLELNSNGLVPGVVISNNLLYRNTLGGIELSGENVGVLPQGVIPVSRIVNNTIVGTEAGTGVGIDVSSQSAPTIINNIITDYATWIQVDASSQAADTVIGSNLYRLPGTNNTGALGDGTFGIRLQPDDPLFVDQANDNYYLAPGSRAIDSGLASLLDRPELVTVKDALGIGLSPTLAPLDDIYGQVRSDDSDAPNTSGQGSNVFIDRGAIDRVDFFQPTGEIVVPQDGSPDDLDADEDEVLLSGPQTTRALTVRLVDQGIGIDDVFDLTANRRNVHSAQFELYVRDVNEPTGLRQLVENVDYVFQYNTFSKEVTFLSVTSFTVDRIYEIWVKNDAEDPADPATFNGVRDLAGNFITANRNDGSTRFFIGLSDGVNDAPVNTVPGAQTVPEDQTLTFAAADRISVSDEDAALGSNELTVTLVASHGTVSSTAVTGVTAIVGGPSVTQANSIVVDTAAAMIGQSVTVGGAAFNFVDLAVVTTLLPTDVGLNQTDNPTAVAGALSLVLNHPKNFGPSTALPSGNTVILSGQSATDPSSATIVLNGATITATDGATIVGNHISVGGTIFTFVDAATVGIPVAEDIVVDLADTSGVVATKTAAVINTFFGAGTAGVAGDVVTLNGVNTESSLLTLRGDIRLLNQALLDLQFVPDANYFGPASVTVLTEDNGEFTFNNRTNARDVDIIPITVTPQNDLPTLDAIVDEVINEDTASLQVNLSGISAGPLGNTPPNETETIRVTATSSDPTIIPDPTVNYTFFDSLASLDFFPVPDAFGVVTITVVVEDAGLDNVFDDDLLTGVDESADNLIITRTFTITVQPVNDAPLLDPIANQQIQEDTGPGSVNLSGISPGPSGENENVRFTAVSSNTGIIVNPTVSYTNPNTTGTLSYDLVPDAFGGPVTITVTLEDAGLDNIFDDDPATIGIDESADNLSTVETFEVDVIPVNDLPTIDPVSDESHPEDGGQKEVPLTGITNGAANENESVIITASSSDDSIIPSTDLLVLYSYPSTSGSLFYTPAPDAFGGPVTITLTVTDGGLDGLLFDDPATLTIDESADNGVVTEQFDVTITEVNDDPEIDAIGNQSIDEDTGPGTVNLTGINNGAANEDDAIRVTATSSDTTIVADPSVTYTSGDTTGNLAYTLLPDAFGTVTITVTVRDAGIDNTLDTADDGITTTTFDIVVNPVNDVPLLDVIADESIDEDAGPGIVNLTGIDNGPANETEDVRISAVSSDPSIIANPTITYTSLNPTGILSYDLVQDAFGGPVTITVTVEDAGLDGVFDDDPGTGLTDESLDNLLIVRTFEVIVNPVNDAPTLDPIADDVIDEDDGPRTVNLTGISNGPANETETVVITATSSDPTLIPNPSISYTFDNPTGTLTYDPVSDQFGGPVTISVTARDAGLDGVVGNADDGITIQTFDVTVNPVNDAPTINSILAQNVDEDSTPPTVDLTGIGTGAANEVQDLMITASSSDQSIIPNSGISITYSSADASGVLDYTLVPDAFGGPVTITVVVTDAGLDGNLMTADDGITATTFVVNVAPVNDDPTIDPIADQAVDEDSGSHNITMTGITNGPPNESEQVQVTAVSSDTSLIPHPVVDYVSGAASGVLTYAPTANNFGGPVTITVTVTDAGLDDVFGTADDGSTQETFEIEVLAQNDAPTLNAIPASITTEDAGTQVVALSGITAGQPNETEGLRVTASIDNGSVLIVPSGGDAVGQVLTVNGVDFTYVTSSTGATTDILIIDVVTLVTVDSTLEVAEATAAAINAHFGAGSASASGNTVSTALPISTASTALQVVPFSSVISNPSIAYNSPQGTGSLSYTTLTNAFGVVTVTVTVTDNGLDDIAGNADDASTTQQLEIHVNALNDIPTLDPLTDLYLDVSDGQQSVNLTGISNGPNNELENTRFFVTSSNTDLIPVPAITYTGGPSGTLTLNPAAGVAGAAIVTVTLEDAGVDGVFDDPLTPENEAADNLRITRTFRVSTPPIISGPTGTVQDNTPLITFSEIPDVNSYQIRLENLTEDTFVFGPGGFGATSVNSFQVTDPLPLGEYRLDIRAIDALGVIGPWSAPIDFIVAPSPVILTPTTERLQDSTPTFSWTSVLGAETYNLAITNTLSGQSFNQDGLTVTQFTVPDGSALALGAYEYTVTAVNPAAASSTSSDVMSSVTANLTVTTPPEVLTPAVAIYNRRPTITWDQPAAAVVSDIEVFNVTTNQVEFVQTGVSGTSYTLSAAQSLGDSEYRIRVRSYGDAARTVASDYSSIHVFQVGSPPVLLGPADGATRTTDARPELTFRGSLTGESYRVWLTSRNLGQRVLSNEDIVLSEGFRPDNDLPIGRYTYWVQAISGDETSAWSQSYDFEVVTPPAITDRPRATFLTQPTIQWGALDGADKYLIWLNKVDVSPAIIQERIEVVGTSYQPTNALPWGKYKIWVRGVAEGPTENVDDTITNYSVPFEFEVGGRPVVTSAAQTSDSTPTLTWERVEQASGYEVFISEETTPGVSLLRQTGINSTSFTLPVEFAEGAYRFWVRAIGPNGELTAWSLNRTSFLTIDSLVPPVIDEIGTASDRTPTITWTQITDAFSYRLYVAPVGAISSPVIDTTVTSAQFTPVNPLDPGTYRAWVRTISSSSEISEWSAAVDFTIAESGKPATEEPVDFLYTSLLGDRVAEWPTTDFTVSQIPAVVIEDSGRRVADTQQMVADRVGPFAEESAEGVVSDANPAELSDKDDVMQDWDSAIWAEEAGLEAKKQERNQKMGWAASLAALTPAMLKRRRKKD